MPADLSKYPSLQELVDRSPSFRAAWLAGTFPPTAPPDAKPLVQIATPKKAGKPLPQHTPVPQGKTKTKRRGGPGTELHAIFQQLGVEVVEGCGCQSLISKMDRWGPSGCRRRMDEIVAHLKKGKREYDWKTKLTAAGKMLTSGLVLKVNPLDPFPGLVEEAIRRAEVKQPHLPVLGPLPEITTRHLLYHVYASEANDIWLRNLAQLKRRRLLFNGRSLFAIATGPGVHPPDAVRAALDWPGAEVIEIENDPQLREVATFPKLLEAIQTTDGQSAFFFAHTKGNSNPCKHKGENPEGIVYWRNAMYRHLLDRWDDVSRLLLSHAMAGTHKQTWTDPGSPFPSKLRPRNAWIFSGTFWWCRCDQVFSRNWRDVPHDRYGAEGWPAQLFHPEETATVWTPWPDETLWHNPYSPDAYRGEDRIEDRPARIGLDLDGTVYAAPDFFRALIDRETAAGNVIVCSSGHSRQDWQADVPRLGALGIDASKFDASLLRDEADGPASCGQKARIIDTCDWAYDDDDRLQPLTKTPIRRPPWNTP